MAVIDSSRWLVAVPRQGDDVGAKKFQIPMASDFVL